MSKTTETAETDETGAQTPLSVIGKELDSILPGKDPMKNLKARQTGAYHYSVLSARNGEPTLHRVDLREPDCTCGDFYYNRDDDEHEICAHIAKAALVHPQLDAGEASVMQLNSYLERIARLTEQIVEERDRARTAAKEAGANQRAVEASVEAAETTQAGGGQTPDVDPEDAADRLKDAYDEIIDDMQVKASDGYVWVQTGKDTPDNLKMPGAPETFETLIRNPDQIKFVGDYEMLQDIQPGEWWKNAIDPGDVDAYINEVLNP